MSYELRPRATRATFRLSGLNSRNVQTLMPRLKSTLIMELCGGMKNNSMKANAQGDA